MSKSSLKTGNLKTQQSECRFNFTKPFRPQGAGALWPLGRESRGKFGVFSLGFDGSTI